MVFCLWRSLSPLLQKTVSPQMWHPPLPRSEGLGWTCLLQSGAWAVDRAAPACWIQLTVHSHSSQDVDKYIYISVTIFLKCVKLGYRHLVVDLLQIWGLNHLHVLIMAVELSFLFFFCIDGVWWGADWRALKSINDLPMLIQTRLNIILISLCGECC